MVRLDFGRSYSPDGRPVLDKIAERLKIAAGSCLPLEEEMEVERDSMMVIGKW